MFQTMIQMDPNTLSKVFKIYLKSFKRQKKVIDKTFRNGGKHYQQQKL